MNGTVRQQIVDLLETEAMDLVQLAQALGIKEKEVRLHLPHIQKSVAARGGRLTVKPAVCSGCGYKFTDRRRLDPPSRCPRCKQLRVMGPWYEVTGL